MSISTITYALISKISRWDLQDCEIRDSKIKNRESCRADVTIHNLTITVIPYPFRNKWLSVRCCCLSPPTPGFSFAGAIAASCSRFCACCRGVSDIFDSVHCCSESGREFLSRKNHQCSKSCKPSRPPRRDAHRSPPSWANRESAHI